jgi:uncharacterized protein (TIGR00369 family)
LTLDTPASLAAFFAAVFPQAARLGFEVVSVEGDGVTLRLDTRDEHLRPGGVVSGPTLMTLSDTAMYAALLARLGEAAVPSVTSSIDIHFLARTPPGRVTIRCRLLRVGRRMAVGVVTFAAADGAETAHATVTYALPSG